VPGQAQRDALGKVKRLRMVGQEQREVAAPRRRLPIEERRLSTPRALPSALPPPPRAEGKIQARTAVIGKVTGGLFQRRELAVHCPDGRGQMPIRMKEFLDRNAGLSARALAIILSTVVHSCANRYLPGVPGSRESGFIIDKWTGKTLVPE
jgi:hypothetical protein